MRLTIFFNPSQGIELLIQNYSLSTVQFIFQNWKNQNLLFKSSKNILNFYCDSTYISYVQFLAF